MLNYIKTKTNAMHGSIYLLLVIMIATIISLLSNNTILEEANQKTQEAIDLQIQQLNLEKEMWSGLIEIQTGINEINERLDQR